MNNSFSKEIPDLQLFWDSTSLGTYKECPRKYELTIKSGWVPRETNVHLTFGLHYHAALETYDHEKAKGSNHDRALSAAVRRALTDTWDFERNKPWNSDDKYKNRYTLVRTIIWYLEHFKEDVAQTIILANGKPAVELSFQFDLGIKAPTNEPYVLCGHLDRLALVNDEPYIIDRKTSKHSVEN
jgi:ATP-dependent exoDNAse (exonuclease V) beta subunit